jgi:hypothetical protein
MAAVRPHVVAGLAYIVLALSLTWPLPLHLGTHLTGSPSGDTGVYVWNLWVFSQEVAQGRLPFYTSTILAASPTLGPVNLSLHNYTTFANLIALPIIPRLGVVSTFNIIYILNIALTGYTMYLLARELIGRHTESWIAGALFTASPMLIARGTAHFSLVAAAPLPLFGLMLSRTIRFHRTRDAALTGLIVAWAAFCDAYYAVYCLLIAIFGLMAHTLQVRRPTGEPQPRRIKFVRFLDIVIIIVGGFIIGMGIRGGGPVTMLGLRVSMRTLYTPVLVLSCLVLLRMLLTLRPRIHVRTALPPRAVLKVAVAGLIATLLPLSPQLYAFGERLSYDTIQTQIYWRSSPPGVDLLAFVLPNPNNAWWGPAIQDVIVSLSQREDGFPEYTASIPFVVLGFLAIAWWRARWRPMPVSVVFPATFALLALGPFIQIAGINTAVPTPWALLRYVPVIGMARSPSRMAVIVMMGIACLFALALAHVTAKYPERRRAILFAVGLLLFIELSPAPRVLYSAEVPSIYGTIAQDTTPGVRVLGLPLGIRDGASSLGNFSALSQYYQTAHGKEIVGGYVSRVSPRRKHRLQRIPMLDALMTLSEGRSLTVEQIRRADATTERFLTRARVKWVVVDRDRTSPELLAFATRTLGLTKVQEDNGRTLYVARPPRPMVELFGDPPSFLDSISDSLSPDSPVSPNPGQSNPIAPPRSGPRASSDEQERPQPGS